MNRLVTIILAIMFAGSLCSMNINDSHHLENKIYSRDQFYAEILVLANIDDCKTIAKLMEENSGYVTKALRAWATMYNVPIKNRIESPKEAFLTIKDKIQESNLTKAELALYKGMIGYCYFAPLDTGVKKDVEEAEKCLREAMGLGSAESIYALALLLREIETKKHIKDPNYQRDYGESIRLMSLAAQRGMPLAVKRIENSDLNSYLLVHESFNVKEAIDLYKMLAQQSKRGTYERRLLELAFTYSATDKLYENAIDIFEFVISKLRKETNVINFNNEKIIINIPYLLGNAYYEQAKIYANNGHHDTVKYLLKSIELENNNAMVLLNKATEWSIINKSYSLMNSLRHVLQENITSGHENNILYLFEKCDLFVPESPKVYFNTNIISGKDFLDMINRNKPYKEVNKNIVSRLLRENDQYKLQNNQLLEKIKNLKSEIQNLNNKIATKNQHKRCTQKISNLLIENKNLQNDNQHNCLRIKELECANEYKKNYINELNNSMHETGLEICQLTQQIFKLNREKEELKLLSTPNVIFTEESNGSIKGIEQQLLDLTNENNTLKKALCHQNEKHNLFCDNLQNEYNSLNEESSKIQNYLNNKLKHLEDGLKKGDENYRLLEKRYQISERQTDDLFCSYERSRQICIDLYNNKISMIEFIKNILDMLDENDCTAKCAFKELHDELVRELENLFNWQCALNSTEDKL